MDNLLIQEGSSSSDVFALAALVVSIISVVATVLLSRRQERRGYMDEFWFREIFAPSCVMPLIEFRAKWEKNLSAVGNSNIGHSVGQKFVDAMGEDVAEILQKIWIARVFNGDFYGFCEVELEHLEDAFAKKLGAAQWQKAAAPVPVAPELVDCVTSVCARLLQRTAVMHGEGLRIVE